MTESHDRNAVATKCPPPDAPAGPALWSPPEADPDLAALMPHLTRLACRGASLDVSVCVNGATAHVAVRAAPVARPGAQPGEMPGQPPLTPTMRLIVGVLTGAERPLKGQAIARRAGKNYCGYFRTALARLSERGIIVVGPDGYEIGTGLPGQPAPTPDEENDPLTEQQLAGRIAAARAERNSAAGHPGTPSPEHRP